MADISKTYDKHYLKLIIIPALLLVLSLSYLLYFYSQNQDIMYKDVSLTGGTTISLFDDIDSKELESFLLKEISDLEMRVLLDNTGKQNSIIIIIKEEDTSRAENLIEEFLGYKLNQENSSIETSSSSLSANFYSQIISAIALAFFWMSAVIFLIFGKGVKVKSIAIVLNIILGILLGRAMLSYFSTIRIVLISGIAIFLLFTYFKNSIPSFAVIVCAFSNLVMTLAVVNLFGMRLSTAGIVAFLMMIGYSVDTDVLLTTRVLKRKHTINKEIFDAFKTGITMTLTSIIAVFVALFLVYNFGSVLNQIFTILLIGLGFDMLNTWAGNASIIKWYAQKNENNI
jgi:preprotein translocase subunit SecF